MRRIIIFVVVGILLIFALTRVFGKKKIPGSAALRRIAGDTLTGTGRRGKTAGAMRAKTKEEIAAEQAKARAAQRKQLRELRRRQREEERAKRRSGNYGYGYGYYGSRTGVRGRRGTMGARTSRKGTMVLYQLRAVFTIDNQNFALIDNRNVAVGDDIMGRKIVEILNDRIIIDEGGQRREVKIGESVLPKLITPTTKIR